MLAQSFLLVVNPAQHQKCNSLRVVESIMYVNFKTMIVMAREKQQWACLMFVGLQSIQCSWSANTDSIPQAKVQSYPYPWNKQASSAGPQNGGLMAGSSSSVSSLAEASRVPMLATHYPVREENRCTHFRCWDSTLLIYCWHTWFLKVRVGVVSM